MIYDEPKHVFPNTWVMLTDIDSGDSAVRGYLKVNLMVLAAVSVFLIYFIYLLLFYFSILFIFY